MNRLTYSLLILAFLAASEIAGLAIPKKVETQAAVFGPYGTIEDVSSNGVAVIVGTNTWTYSPELIDLYLSENVVFGTAVPSGWHPGTARVSKSDGPEGCRLDFNFDCTTADDPGSCAYRLIVRFGSYEAETDVVVFDFNEMQLYSTDGVLLRIGAASFTIAFEAEEEPTKSENCNNGKDDDGDGLIDCADPDCDGNKACR